MMKKMLAGPVVPVCYCSHSHGGRRPGRANTPVDDATTSVDNSDDDDDRSSKVGLLGLAGLAGLAGLKRNDHDNRTQYQQHRPQV